MAKARSMVDAMAASLLVLLGLWGCSSTASTESGTPASLTALSSVSGGRGDLRAVDELPAPPAVASGVAQPVSVEDVLEVSVFQVPDLSRTVQVDDSGNITLPLIGQIPAAGKSVQSLQREIEAAYASNYLQSPSVSVFLKESAARRVTLDGELKRAGVYPLPPSASLLDAVALAGGFSEVADPSKVYVFRKVGDTNYVANYNVDEIRRGGRRNPAIHGGDVVVVFRSQSRVALQNLKEALGLATSAGRLAVL